MVSLTPCDYIHTHDHSEDGQSLPTKGGLTVNTDPIPVVLEETGYPILPEIRMGGGNQTKMVQCMLRDYMTAHIR